MDVECYDGPGLLTYLRNGVEGGCGPIQFRETGPSELHSYPPCEGGMKINNSASTIHLGNGDILFCMQRNEVSSGNKHLPTARGRQVIKITVQSKSLLLCIILTLNCVTSHIRQNSRVRNNNKTRTPHTSMCKRFMGYGPSSRYVYYCRDKQHKKRLPGSCKL